MSSARHRLRIHTVLVALVCAAGRATAQPAPPAPPAGGGEELSDQGKLDSAKTLYDAGKYAECVKQFDALIGKEPRHIHDPDVLEKARVYYAACLIANNQVPLADEQMRLAIKANPTMNTPDSLVFPQKVINRFIKVKSELLDVIRAAEAAELKRKQAEAKAAAARAARERERVAALEERASQEFLVHKNSRALAAVPFGVGQFQNREPALGWLFLSSEAILAGTALTSMLVEINLLEKESETPKPDPNDLNPKLKNWHTALVISSWGFLGLAATGIAQAEIGFVPEFREVRRRGLPPELRRPPENGVSLRPLAVPVPGGMSIGVTGHF